jgi:SAM-dependent methyltransferase
MPMSDPSHRPWVLDRLFEIPGGPAGIKTVVDVGAGGGGWRLFLGPHLPNSRWTAVEIWEPYVDRFMLRSHYQEVIVADVRDLDPFPAADLVIFGDVLEHMPAGDAVTVWDRARAAAGHLVIGIPVRPYPQGESQGNPWEAHVEDWSDYSVRKVFPGIVAGTCGPDTGAYLAVGLAG